MASRDEKDALIWVHQDHDSPLARERGEGLRAGIFLLDGRCHVAAHGSPAASRLRERGALHVANLVVDPGTADRAALSGGSSPEAPPAPELRPLRRREAARTFGAPAHPN